MKAEHAARLFVVGLAIGLPAALLGARLRAPQAVELHVAMAEDQGWTPADLTVKAGQPLRLRLTSDDVLHGFAVGQMDWPAIDVKPGEWSETTLTFEQPGKYTFYCTRWCGPGHWRMRGTIEVTGGDGTPQAGPATPPLYATLGLDLDAPHPAPIIPGRRPSAERGAQIQISVPSQFRRADFYRATSPSDAYQALRTDPAAAGLSDEEVWDQVARVWAQNTSASAISEARQLYARNCAACHGETGQGDGVMAAALGQATEFSRDTKKPVNFTHPDLLGASPALLQGKIIRGGMGTGMPYWGPIFTEAQTWALVSYLYTFTMDTEVKP